MEGRVAIVTGASSGIGLAVAKMWCARGGRVALVARTQRTLDDAVTAIGGDRAAAFPLDVQNLAAVADLPKRVVDHFGRLDVVVNNAGLNHRGPIDKFTALELADVITTNLTAPIVLTRAALPHLPRGGAVIQLASLAGMVPVPHEAAYSASKAGLRAFARAAAQDVEDAGVHIGIVSPGPVDTGFLGDLSEVPDIVLSQPMSTADEVAEAVLRAIHERVAEIVLPSRSGRLATLAYVVPGLARKLRPVLERRGARNKQAILAKRRSAS